MNEDPHSILTMDVAAKPTPPGARALGQARISVRETSKKMESSSAMGMDLTTRLMCGGTAGCVARTFVAPIDRVKLLLQTQHVTYKGATRYSGVIGTMRGVMAEEGGLSALWRGNGVNCVRVFPYAATQFASFDFFKQLALDLRKSGSAEGEWSSASRSRKRPRHWEDTGRGSSGNDSLNARAKPTISVLDRLVCGGLAGATATTLTHPLDVVRLRLAVSSKQELSGPWSAVRNILREGGARALYKGYVPTIISLAPFIAINFSAFDTIKAKLGVAEMPAGQKQVAT